MELRLKAVEEAPRTQCREKQGFSVRGKFVTMKLRNIFKI